MEITAKIDWLTLTKKIRKEVVDQRLDKKALLALLCFEASLVGVDAREVEVVNGDGFYALHVLFPLCGVRASIDFEIEKQGMRLVFGGKALVYENFGQRVLASAVEHDWKPTRIDLAVDIMNSGVTVEDVFYAYDKVHGEQKQRTVEFKKRKNGDSLYIGARTSEKMLRVYDKAKEQALDHDWIRYEMEYKGEAALTMVPKLLASIQHATMAHVGMLSLPSFPISMAIEDFSQGEPVKFERALPTKDGQEKWLYGVVGKKLARLRADDRVAFDNLMTYVEEMCQGYEEQLI